jgi:hypothetical protein
MTTPTHAQPEPTPNQEPAPLAPDDSLSKPSKKSRHFTNYKTACWLKKRKFPRGPGQSWNLNPRSPVGGYRKDLFGFADLITFRADFGILAAQACTASDLAAHRSDIQDNADALGWLQSGGRLYIFSWRKVRRKGREVWQPRIERAALRDGDSRIRFYVVTDAAFKLPGGARQREPQPSQEVDLKSPAKAPSIPGKAVKIQPPAVLQRRRALMLKRQEKRALSQSADQQPPLPPAT